MIIDRKSSKGYKKAYNDSLSKSLITNENNLNYSVDIFGEEKDNYSDRTKASKNSPVRKTYRKSKSLSEKQKKKKTKGNKKVKFSYLRIVKVECWKKYNINLEMKENLEKLIKTAKENKKGKDKTISCSCIII